MASTLYGRQQPTARVCPEYAETHGPRVCKLMQKAGFELMPWQRGLLDDWMGRKPNGEWSASTAGGSVPRQNGKTRDVAARCAGGMMLYGEWIVYTSHLQKTSTETFEEVRSIFESNALKKYVKDVKAALGREEITLVNGGRIKFLARTRNGGRGQHGDLLICDEAQELTDEQQGSFLPILAASKNPQTIYIGTPPDESAPGVVFKRIRREALSGKTSKTAWSEWSVTEIGDTSDRERWAESNPSFGYMIKESTVEAEHEQMADDKFARERLGWWSDDTAGGLFSMDEWNELAAGFTDEEIEAQRDWKLAYAVRFSADGQWASIAVAIWTKGEIPHVEVMERRSTEAGIGWAVDIVSTLWGRACTIVIDGKSNAQDFYDRLISNGVNKRALKLATVDNVTAASSMFTNAVSEGKLTHNAQPDLDDAVRAAQKREVGKGGGYGFKSANGTDITPLEAASLAMWGVRTSRRNPARRLRVR